MFENSRVSVVVPAFNEEKKIYSMLASIPRYVDAIYVINDCSRDNTAMIVNKSSQTDSRIKLISHEENRGVGASIATGYREAINNQDDIAVVMAGDGQMHPDDLPRLLRPIADGKCDYAKGNRFLSGRSELNKIPVFRLFGNLVLSMLTKIASGYWHVSDSQSGYTAINRRALEAIDWSRCYPRYGCPNDFLVKLNIANMRVADIPVSVVYGEDWASNMSPLKVVCPILFLISKLFWRRMFVKYFFLNGHPLLLFYGASVFGFLLSLVLAAYIVWQFVVAGRIPQTATILLGICIVMTLQSLLHAFSMDYRDNEWLFVHDRN